jgi:hypothetical protein
MRRKRHEPLPQEDMDIPFGPPPEEYRYRCRSAMKRCWSMKPSLMWLLARPNSGVNIKGGCPRWSVQDATVKPWSTSIKSPSPPAGRFVHVMSKNRR